MGGICHVYVYTFALIKGASPLGPGIMCAGLVEACMWSDVALDCALTILSRVSSSSRLNTRERASWCGR